MATDIEEEQAKRFLRRLRRHPFIALVVNDDGSVEVFHRGIEPEHITRMQDALEAAEENHADKK